MPRRAQATPCSVLLSVLNKKETFMPLLSTRRFLAAMLGLALPLAATVPAAHAQSAANFPDKPIVLVVTGAPGASTDLIGRRLARVIQAQTGATVVIDNKAGASGSIGVVAAIRAPADGYTLAIAVPDSVTVYPALKKVRPYSIEKDMTPIAQVAEAHFVFVVNARNPANNMAEFAAALKARPKAQQFSYGSPGVGTTSRLVTEMLLQRTNGGMVHVPYRSTAPAMVGLVGGEVEIVATSIASAKALSDAGKVKVIGIARETRLPGFESVPTLVEAGFPGFVVPVWWGVFTGANVPADVREKLSAMFVKAAESEDFRSQVVALGLEPRTRSSSDFANFLRTDTETWVSAIRKAEIPLED